MKTRGFLFALAAAALWACGGRKHFRLEVDAPSIGTQEITIVYGTEDGNRAVATVPAINGRFEFEGSSEEPSVVEIFGANKRRLAAMLLRNGDDARLAWADSAWTVSGSELSQLLLDYRPGDDTSVLPEAVAEAIATVYGPTGEPVRERFGSQELLIARDSVAEFPAEGIWVFTAEAADRTKALGDTLRRYARQGRAVRDVFVSTDTAYWRMIRRTDSATWTQGFMPDAPLRLRGVAGYIPCLLEVDSAGCVVRVQRLP